ncbi:Cupin domain-containing protein [Isoptericola jiangsuensis]|uniref:Cupin domain-containing protein n=1 Tax=Isoptericola jiangsuensis TaxID=548579 RepID=A0A2A9EZP3_9MICO|nr:cupin domain-containing protein [Isoptericola jiangsuensis]PFG43695.1 Cupin domain-containing protein [Isoptericola jiangsuensis]
MGPVHVPPGEGRTYRMIDGDHVAKAVVEGDGGAFEVFEVISPPAPPAPPHVSPWGGALYLLQGRVTAVVDGTSFDVEPGALVMFPAGKPCTFEVVGETARFLAVTTGDRAGRFFADLAGAVPADRPVEESLAAIDAVTRRHGVAMAGD